MKFTYNILQSPKKYIHIAIILNVTPSICAQKVFTTKHRSEQRYNNNKNTDKTRAKKREEEHRPSV